MGPATSNTIAIGLPASEATARTMRASSRHWSGVPWLALRRKPSAPADTISLMAPTVRVAGPSVARIFARRFEGLRDVFDGISGAEHAGAAAHNRWPVRESRDIYCAPRRHPRTHRASG